MNYEKLKSLFKKLKCNNAVSHAYLISNSKYNKMSATLEWILKNIIFEDDFNFDNSPDIITIFCDGTNIKKEQIMDLEHKFSTTSQLSNNKVYIIDECDRLNSSAANCLLKFLEEPSENIYAFLLTENIDNVMPTIKSRCQILHMFRENEKKEKNENYQKSIDIIQELEKYKNKNIVYNANKFYSDFDKENYKNILDYMQCFYFDSLLIKLKLTPIYFEQEIEFFEEIVKNNSMLCLIKKIKILNNAISLLEYNVNNNLFLDKLLIEFGRV